MVSGTLIQPAGGDLLGGAVKHVVKRRHKPAG